MTKNLTQKELSIKYMVCPRCIESVQKILMDLGMEIKEIELGKAIVEYVDKNIDNQTIRQNLKEKGFELVEDKEQVIITKTKALIIHTIHHQNLKPKVKNSVLLAERAGISYSKLSKLFSSLEGITIEKYIILQKIEKVKELITYQEKTMSEIAFEMGYSSSQHLSNQFKSITGMSVREFKQLKYQRRKSLDEV